MADKRRRKSLSFFKHKNDDGMRPLTPTGLPSHVKDEEMPYSNSNLSENGSPKIQPRTLQKGGRTSMFGSFRSLHSLGEDEKAPLTRTDSMASSLTSSTYEGSDLKKKTLLGKTVILYGESQTAVGNVFRKKSQFIVLTDSHLVRFRSQTKAAEMFPIIPATITRTNTRTSIGSTTDMQLSAYQDITSGVPLEEVIAVYNLDDGRPFFTVEVAHLDRGGKRASALQIHLHDPGEFDRWMSSIRQAVAQAVLRHKVKIPKSATEYVVRALNYYGDYDPASFRVFKVAQRASSKSGHRASAEDLTKVTSSICYMAFGLHKLHLLPVSRASQRSSVGSISDVESPISFGYMALTGITLQTNDDSFQLTFKHPCRTPTVLSLASSECGEIALLLRYVSETLRPEWLRQPFFFEVPSELEDRVQFPPPVNEDYACLDRTLTAHCVAYEVDVSRICYTVDHNCEDAPRFQLLATVDGRPYTAAELMAVLRSLRYNESFATISFANVNLCPLRYLYDAHAVDLDSLCDRSGAVTNLAGHYDLPVLCQEVRALALKSRRLRRLDFSSAFPRLSQGREERDSCCVPEALVPLFKKSLTNVDWLILNGVNLTDSDLNFLVDAASERSCHLRALEIAQCGLSVHDVDVLLSTLAIQERTMEVINISGVQGRFSPEMFQRAIGVFSHIRRLDLSRVQKAGPEPLIPPELLMSWRLEALYISGTSMNEQTVDAISAYLASAKSAILRDLHMDQCGLSGRDLAIFFRSMTHTPGQMRHMHLSASENRLKLGMSNLFNAIREGFGPSSLTMRMMDFEKEHQFREFMEAVQSNTTLRSLDISGASLPYDASAETCEALKKMFAMNKCLEELDISGEQAHLDASRFGIGLNDALEGLKRNTTLRLLRIEHQKLGLQGANTLAGVIENNQTLLEIHCEHNELNLQSFTVLVNALEKNHVLRYLPTMEDDWSRSLDKIVREADSIEGSESHKYSSPRKTSGSLKRSFAGALGGNRKSAHQRVTSSSSTKSHTSQDTNLAINVLEEKWQIQISRLQNYLSRNNSLANGTWWQEGGPGANTERQSDSEATTSLQKMFDGMFVGELGSDRGVERGKRNTPGTAAIFELPEH